MVELKQNFNFIALYWLDPLKNSFMAEKVFEKKHIIIPNAHHYYAQSRQKIQNQESKPHQYKLFISPNRETKPLGLVHSKLIHQAQKNKEFHPSFDNFDLSSMFSNKKLSSEEMLNFKTDHQYILHSFQTPQRKIQHLNHDFNSILIQNTENTLKMSAQAKKSRPKSKGLRKLSQRAFQIVLNFKSVSYKQVANKLIDQLNSQKELDQLVYILQYEGKDQQNIKRRVYDALNVLIALGVLRKQGRKIVGDRFLKFKQGHRDSNALTKEVEIRSQTLIEKRQQLSDLKRKYDTLKDIENRNIIQIETEESQKVEMPFIIIKNQADETFKSQNNVNTKLCQKLMIKWLKSQGDFMNMDIQILSQKFKIEKQKTKIKIEQNK